MSTLRSIVTHILPFFALSCGSDLYEFPQPEMETDTNTLPLSTDSVYEINLESNQTSFTWEELFKVKYSLYQAPDHFNFVAHDTIIRFVKNRYEIENSKLNIIPGWPETPDSLWNSSSRPSSSSEQISSSSEISSSLESSSSELSSNDSLSSDMNHSSESLSSEEQASSEDATSSSSSSNGIDGVFTPCVSNMTQAKRILNSVYTENKGKVDSNYREFSRWLLPDEENPQLAKGLSLRIDNCQWLNRETWNYADNALGQLQQRVDQKSTDTLCQMLWNSGEIDYRVGKVLSYFYQKTAQAHIWSLFMLEPETPNEFQKWVHYDCKVENSGNFWIEKIDSAYIEAF